MIWGNRGNRVRWRSGPASFAPGEVRAIIVLRGAQRSEAAQSALECYRVGAGGGKRRGLRGEGGSREVCVRDGKWMGRDGWDKRAGPGLARVMRGKGGVRAERGEWLTKRGQAPYNFEGFHGQFAIRS